MPTRLVPAVALVVLLITSPIAGVTAAAPPDEGAAGGSAGGSGTASGGASAGGSGSAAAANDTRTLDGVGGVIDAAPAVNGGRYLVGTKGLEATNTTVTRVGPNGTVQWQRRLGSTNESRRAVAVVSGDRAGAYLLELVGAAAGPEAPDDPPELRLSRLGPDGERRWSNSLGNATGFYTTPVMAASDEGVVLARPVEGESPATRLTRFAPDGTVDWDRSYAGGTPRALAETPGGDLVLAGQREYREGWLLRLHPNGSVALNETFGVTERRIVGVTPTDDGGVLVAGSAATRGFSGSDPWVARIDEAGAVRWSRTYGTTDREYPRAAVATEDGLLLLSTRNGASGERATVLTHVTADGAVGTGTIANGPGISTPVPTADGRVDLYGFELDRRNRTVTGTVRTAAVPTPTRPDWPVHDTIASNETFYRGQNLQLPGDGNRTYDLYRLPSEYTEFDEPTLVRRVSGGDAAPPAFETATLPQGQYAVRAASEFWYRIDDGRYSLVERPEEAAFTLGEQDIWRIQSNRTVVATFAGERLVSARIDSDPRNMTARVGLTRLNGTSVSETTLADALAPGSDERVAADRVFTVGDRAYGTVELRAARNLTLDADALPAGLYELTLTGNETADAIDPATTRLVVVDERRNVSLTPANRTLTVSRNGSATTDLTVSGVDSGLGAIRIDAERRGQPTLRLDLEFTDAVDYGSARGGAGISSRRSTAEIQSLDVRNAPNGSFAVAALTVEPERFGRQDDASDEGMTGEQTVTVGLTYVVDADGVPYSLTGDETVTVEVVESEDAS